MERDNKMLSVFTIITWAIFVLLDYELMSVISRALREDWPGYIELYNPLNFFRYVFLFGSLILTTITLYRLCFNKPEES